MLQQMKKSEKSEKVKKVKKKLKSSNTKMCVQKIRSEIERIHLFQD